MLNEAKHINGSVDSCSQKPWSYAGWRPFTTVSPAPTSCAIAAPNTKNNNNKQSRSSNPFPRYSRKNCSYPSRSVARTQDSIMTSGKWFRTLKNRQTQHGPGTVCVVILQFPPRPLAHAGDPYRKGTTLGCSLPRLDKHPL